MPEHFETPKSATKEALRLPSETIRVGKKLMITGIPLEHVQDIDRYRSDINNKMIISNGVIAEYFPPEIRDIDPNFLTKIASNATVFMPFFDKVLDYAKANKKDVFVLDPAYSGDFQVMRTGFAGLNHGISLIASKFLYDTFQMFKGNKQADTSEDTLTRRQLLTRVGVGGLAAAIGAKVSHGTLVQELNGNPTQIPSEFAFRRAVVAQGIRDIAKDLDNDPKAYLQHLLLFYPPIHWEGIKTLLQNPEGHDIQMSRYNKMKGLGYIKNKFFTKRQYRYQGNNWTLVGKTEIK